MSLWEIGENVNMKILVAVSFQPTSIWLKICLLKVIYRYTKFCEHHKPRSCLKIQNMCNISKIEI